MYGATALAEPPEHAALCWGGIAAARATPLDSMGGPSVDVSSTLTSSYLDIESVLASSGMPSSAQSFLLPDELPSPLDSRTDAATMLPAPALLPLHLDSTPINVEGTSDGAGPGPLPRALSFTGGTGELRPRDREEEPGSGGAKRQRSDAASAASMPSLEAALTASKPPARRAPPPRPVAEKRKGPCNHCGAVESPLWRKGPPGKPVLCNRCGTKHSRGHGLGPAMARAPQRRG